MTKSLSLALLVAGILVSLAVEAKVPAALKSVDVTLPDSDRALPAGPNLEVVNGNCLSCHSGGMIMNQPMMPKAAWEAVVAKMRNVYKAPVDEKDVALVVEYLAAVKSPK